MWVKKWKVIGSTGKEYKVSLKEDGTYACGCPAWIFKRGQKVDCRHIREVLGIGKVVTILPKKVNTQKPVPAQVIKKQEETFTVRMITFEDVI